MQIHGILNLNKPPKITSRQAVDQIKRLLKVKKAGHGGTLDPDATGVLLICLGDATKLFDSLQVGTKEYECLLTLGTTTDTLDASGQIVDTFDTDGITPDQVRTTVGEFIGEIEQTVPMFSAVKFKGRRLHQLARQGIEVEELPKRKVTIESIEVLSINLPEVRIQVVCSKGTYIRSLVADIGYQLGCGAHLSQLIRTRSGRFKIADGHSLTQLEGEPSRAYQAVIPIEVVVETLNR